MVTYLGGKGGASPALTSGFAELIDVVLLPVERSVGLDDDVFMRVLLEFVDEHGFAGLERFGDFGMDAQRQVGIVVIGDCHFASFGLNFVAESRNGLDHAGAAA